VPLRLLRDTSGAGARLPCSHSSTVPGSVSHAFRDHDGPSFPVLSPEKNTAAGSVHNHGTSIQVTLANRSGRSPTLQATAPFSGVGCPRILWIETILRQLLRDTG
jgi:hypothetical protein